MLIKKHCHTTPWQGNIDIMGKCNLCLQEKQLITKSHIIPDFMYQDLFDDKHKMLSFNPYERAKGEGYIKKPSTGEYEGEILCADCDNSILGSYEDYASKAIYGGQLHANECPTFTNYKNQAGIEFTLCKNLNYQKFKIFLLSILWRASISSRKFFSDISLGPHEEIIRKMIFVGNASEVDNYPIFMMTYINDKSMPRDFVSQPQKRKTKDGFTTYIFFIGGLIYFFYVNSENHKIPDYILSETIKKTNEANIIHIPPGQGWDLILGYYGFKK